MRKLCVLMIILVCFGVRGFALSSHEGDVGGSGPRAAQHDEASVDDEDADVEDLAAGLASLVVDELVVAEEHSLVGKPPPQVDGQENQDNQCPSCYNAYDDLDHLVVTLPCHLQNPLARKHRFCFSCLHAWLINRDKNDCPTCRTEVFPGFKKFLMAGVAPVNLWLLLDNLSRCSAAGLVDEVGPLREQLMHYMVPFDEISVDAGLELAAQFRQRIAIVALLLGYRKQDSADSCMGLESCYQTIIKICENMQWGDQPNFMVDALEFAFTCSVRQEDQEAFGESFGNLMRVLGQLYFARASASGCLDVLNGMGRFLKGCASQWRQRDFLRCPWLLCENFITQLSQRLEEDLKNGIPGDVTINIMCILSYFASLPGFEFDQITLNALVGRALVVAKLDSASDEVCAAALDFVTCVVAHRNSVYHRAVISEMLAAIAAQRGVCGAKPGLYLFNCLADKERNYLKDDINLIREALTVVAGRHAYSVLRRIPESGPEVMLQQMDENGLLEGIDFIEDAGIAAINMFEYGNSGATILREIFKSDTSRAYEEKVIKFFLTYASQEDQSAERVTGALRALLEAVKNYRFDEHRNGLFEDPELKENLVTELCGIVLKNCSAQHRLVVAALEVLRVVSPCCSRQQAIESIDNCLLPKFWSLLQSYRQEVRNNYVPCMASLLAVMIQCTGSSGSRVAMAFCQAADAVVEGDDDVADLIKVLGELISKPYNISFSSRAREMMQEKIVDRFSARRAALSDSMLSAVTGFDHTLNRHGCCMIL